MYTYTQSLRFNHKFLILSQLSTSFYVYQVAKKLKEAEKILVCMGYECSTGPQEVQEYKYLGEVKTEQVAEVVTDLVILHSELERIQDLVQGAIHEKYVNVQLRDILAARAHPHEELGAALYSSAREAHRRLLAQVHPQVVTHHHPHHHSPPLPSQHASTGTQYPGQQFHQATGTACQPQNSWSNPQAQRGTENVSSTFMHSGSASQGIVSSQHNHGFLQKNVPQQQSDQFHSSNQVVYHNLQVMLDHETKLQYGPDGKMFSKDNLKPRVGTANVPLHSNKARFETEQRPHAESKPPDPFDLPEPVFQENQAAVENYQDEFSSGNLSLLIDSRSVQSDASGFHVDCMLSNESESHPRLHAPEYNTDKTNVCSPEDIIEHTHHSPEKHNELETSTTEPQPPTEMSKPNSQEVNSAICIPKKPVPTPRHKNQMQTTPVQPRMKMSGEQYTSETEPTDSVIAQGSSVASTESTNVDQSSETEQSKPYSSPHPSLENNSAPASIESECGLPDPGRQSMEESSTLLQDTDTPLENKVPKVRERSNAILGTQMDMEKRQQASAEPRHVSPHLNANKMDCSGSFIDLDKAARSKQWICDYCTNINHGETNCEICGHKSPEKTVTVKKPQRSLYSQETQV